MNDIRRIVNQAYKETYLNKNSNNKGPLYAIRKKDYPTYYIHFVDNKFALKNVIEGAATFYKDKARAFVAEDTEHELEYIKVKFLLFQLA